MAIVTQSISVLDHLEEFEKIVGNKYVFVDEEILNSYAHDETEHLHFLPDVVIKPRTPEEVSAILKLCNRYKIQLLHGVQEQV
jgi:glycolate oxidase